MRERREVPMEASKSSASVLLPNLQITTWNQPDSEFDKTSKTRAIDKEKRVCAVTFYRLDKQGKTTSGKKSWIQPSISEMRVRTVQGTSFPSLIKIHFPKNFITLLKTFIYSATASPWTFVSKCWINNLNSLLIYSSFNSTTATPFNK